MNFDQMMAELRIEYVVSIPKKITDIETHLREGSVDKLRDDFHKLKGTGKTYGIPEITDLGLVVEKICLEKKDVVKITIPMAVQVLLAIYTKRLNNEAYVITGDENFKKISSLL